MARWEVCMVVFVACAALMSSAKAQTLDGIMGNPGCIPQSMDDGHSRCSNNGMWQADAAGNRCECYQCWSGDKCETYNPDCVMVVHGGDPMMFENYWVDQPDVTVSLDASYRLAGDDSASGEECLGLSGNNVAACGMLPELEATIRDLHRLIGNANVDPDRHIVLSFGSTQLINAAAFALLDRENGTESVISAGEVPWYGDYRRTGMFYNSNLFRWTEENEDLSGKRVIEYITHPNNPDGTLRRRTVPDSLAVWDHAYYWPHFTPIVGPVGEADYYRDTDIIMFTLSKMTGHAGTRLGWAITKDAETARRMAEFVTMTTGSVSREVQLRANALLDHIVKTDGKIFNYASDEMERRWDRLLSIFGEDGLDTGNIFSLQTLEESAYCNFRKQVKRQSPAYVWFTCNRDSEIDYVLDVESVKARVAQFGIPSDPDMYTNDEIGCYAHLLYHNVSGVHPTSYGATKESLRLELLERGEDFDLIADKLEQMVVEMTPA